MYRKGAKGLQSHDMVHINYLNGNIIKVCTIEWQTGLVQPQTSIPLIFLSCWWEDSVRDITKCIEYVIIGFRENKTNGEEARCNCVNINTSF